jgi:membrane-bound acyltransferase YfiQ involved in biofilm formation
LFFSQFSSLEAEFKLILLLSLSDDIISVSENSLLEKLVQVNQYRKGVKNGHLNKDSGIIFPFFIFIAIINASEKTRILIKYANNNKAFYCSSLVYCKSADAIIGQNANFLLFRISHPKNFSNVQIRNSS